LSRNGRRPPRSLIKRERRDKKARHPSLGIKGDDIPGKRNREWN
jgi:hypothetical protein